MAREAVNISTPMYRQLTYQAPSYTDDYYRKVRNGEPLTPLAYFMAEISSRPATVWKFTTWRGMFNSTIIPKQMLCIQDGDYQMWGKQECKDWIDSQIVAGRRNKLLSKVKGQTLPLIMLYKERHQTNAMLTKFFDDMIFFARNYKRPRRLLQHYGFLSTAPKGYQKARKWYKQRKASHTVGDYYLQWRFGWNPLYKDLEDSVKAQSEAEKKGRTTKMRAGLPFEVTRERINTLAAERASVDGTCTATGYFGICAHYHISDVTLAAAVQVMSVEETLWDMMPWSFLIDRLVNVSKYLNLRYATAGVQFISGYESDYRRYVTRGISNCKSSRTVLGSKVYAWTYWDGPSREDVLFNRTIISGFPKPTLEYPYKSFLDQKYWGDYVSLINQKFHKRVF